LLRRLSHHCDRICLVTRLHVPRIMGRWREAKSKLNALHAIRDSRGGIQYEDPAYEQSSDEPKDTPPSTPQPRAPQPLGQNASYYQPTPWSPLQSAVNLPGRQYGHYPQQTFQSLTQGYFPSSQAQPQYGYGDPHQNAILWQGPPTYATGNHNAHQSNQRTHYAHLNTQDSTGNTQYPLNGISGSASETPSSLPYNDTDLTYGGEACSPPISNASWSSQYPPTLLQRSATEPQWQAGAPPMQRNLTMPAPPEPHDCNQNWEP
jgi:hypothetical protein